MIIAIEGIDGAGKNTVANQLKAVLIERGLSADVIEFPQVENTYGGRALGDFLAGRHRTPDDVKVIAALYAIDRLEYLDIIRSRANEHDVLIFDRYIASNLAFQAAKTVESQRYSLMNWIVDLETKTFGMPAPNLNVLLRTHIDQAKQNVSEKALRNYTKESFDIHEQDKTLQSRAQYMYNVIVDKDILGPWLIIDTTSDAGGRKSPQQMARQIADHVKL
ncbi:hypothetical protein [Mesorhizobium sp. J428]|uniref:hypothetical protein n=1 Tax=Mesorhizobium sp. J428 TaxID=2898440 RepID=UPI002150E684|nr:hypothetical protein [Mesorhizobium sp. J428]MCR5857566.1 hypothetical protein [Mesorhizobium sp. J428]